MLMMVCVPLALLAAGAACLQARFHHSARELGNELRLPAQDSSGRDADVTAVLTESDAAELLLDMWLTEARVGAGGAALGAVKAGFDAGDQRGRVYLNRPRMRLQHLLSVRHLYLLVVTSRDLSGDATPKLFVIQTSGRSTM
jgi:hypothetical protein